MRQLSRHGGAKAVAWLLLTLLLLADIAGGFGVGLLVARGAYGDGGAYLTEAILRSYADHEMGRVMAYYDALGSENLTYYRSHFQPENSNLVFARSCTNGNCAVVLFSFAYYEHIRSLLELSFTYLVADFLVSVVEMYSDSCLVELLCNLCAVIVERVRYGKNLNLYGREPKRERACEMLCDNADESFDRAENNAVDHDGTMLFVVRAGVFKLESFGKLHIELNCTALPCSAETVGNVEVELRSVERAVALVDNVSLAHFGYGFFKSFRSEIPVLYVAHVVLWHCGNFNFV